MDMRVLPQLARRLHRFKRATVLLWQQAMLVLQDPRMHVGTPTTGGCMHKLCLHPCVQVTAADYSSAKPDPVASFAPHVAGHMNGEESHIQVGAHKHPGAYTGCEDGPLALPYKLSSPSRSLFLLRCWPSATPVLKMAAHLCKCVGDTMLLYGALTCMHAGWVLICAPDSH